MKARTLRVTFMILLSLLFAACATVNSFVPEKEHSPLLAEKAYLAGIFRGGMGTELNLHSDSGVALAIVLPLWESPLFVVELPPGSYRIDSLSESVDVMKRVTIGVPRLREKAIALVPGRIVYIGDITIKKTFLLITTKYEAIIENNGIEFEQGLRKSYDVPTSMEISDIES